jgi:hypothetical protein
MEKEPKLEEYGLTLSSYEDYKNQKNELDKNLPPYSSSEWGYILFILAVFIALILQSGIIFIIGLVIMIAFFINEKSKDKERIKIVAEYNEKIELIKNKVLPFEESCKTYYLNYLEQFYQNNIYKKRSGNEKFEHSILEFSSMVNEVEEISNKLIFIEMKEDVLSHKGHLIGRLADHKYQIDKKFNTFDNINDSNKKETVSNIKIHNKETKEDSEKFILKYTPPEKRYITPRKIDNWDEINKKRKETGDKGEEIAIAIERDFLESVNRRDLADKIKHVSLETGDGLGYDILSFWENGKEKYIEVKSTTVNINSPFNISRNELNFLKEHKEDSFIYRILITEKEPEFVAIPSYVVLEGEITATSFLVKVE